jgi:Vitamin K-dependent gamma-carboxylase
MTLELAVRSAEILLGFALLQQSVEFMRVFFYEKFLGLTRAFFAILLILGFAPLWIESVLLITSVMLLKRFNGPYNGGSDAMTLLLLMCLWLSHLAVLLPFPTALYWQEIALGYLCFQLIFSYVQSGWVKIINEDWRSGRALQQVFAITAYPVSEQIRLLAARPQLLMAVSWAVMIIELLFPLVLLNQTVLFFGLGVMLIFHLANAILFGLNRFFWIWPAAYPVLIWFQARLMNAI